MLNLKLPFSQIKDSFKEIKLNMILDKMSRGESITDNEKSFLKSYELEIDDWKDYKLLSKENIVERVKYILPKKKIICNLEDNDGKIGSMIMSIDNDFHGECLLKLRNGMDFKIGDNHLYNLIFSLKKDQYSLESEDEYYEKIEVK